MATLNAPATLEIGQNFGADYATSTIEILAGANVLVSHTTTSWSVSNTGQNGTVQAAIANAGAETITGAGSQTATSARMTSGAEVITLTVGLAGSGPAGADPDTDLIFSTLTYVNGETSTLSSLVVTVPATPGA